MAHRSKKCLREKSQDLIRNLYQQQQHKQQQQKNQFKQLQDLDVNCQVFFEK